VRWRRAAARTPEGRRKAIEYARRHLSEAAEDRAANERARLLAAEPLRGPLTAYESAAQASLLRQAGSYCNRVIEERFRDKEFSDMPEIPGLYHYGQPIAEFSAMDGTQ
jgi:hypothetical protein